MVEPAKIFSNLCAAICRATSALSDGGGVQARAATVMGLLEEVRRRL
jgi:hypothetical protein